MYKVHAEAIKNKRMSTNLIAYYSRTGNNYANGKIMNLTVGNTAVIAGKIKELTGSDLFEIKTIKRYPDDYAEATRVSRIELKNKERPGLSEFVSGMERYNIIYLGFPNWWGTMPMAVFTFLETYDFRGKTIVPFCTHEGSGLGRSETDIKQLVPGSNVLKGIAIRGSSVSEADKELINWLKGNKLI
jgi:flavodoxin